jgi:Cu-Zn family superoxide dismutase
LLLAPGLLLASCTTPLSPTGAKTDRPALSVATPIAAATLVTGTGAPAGSATLVAGDGRLVLIVAAENLPAGVHGLHLHAVGECDAPGFATAGGHLNPGGKMHGKDNPMGSHLGDLPNLEIAADGTGTLTAPIAGSAADLSPLFDADGVAVIVHADADDYKTDPSGNSGARIACGVLQKS